VRPRPAVRVVWPVTVGPVARPIPRWAVLLKSLRE
jgi:hypothetical protein